MAVVAASAAVTVAVRVLVVCLLGSTGAVPVVSRAAVPSAAAPMVVAPVVVALAAPVVTPVVVPSAVVLVVIRWWLGRRIRRRGCRVCVWLRMARMLLMR